MKNKRMLITLIILLAIGFATVSSTLIINGNILIGENKNDFNVIFTDAILDGKSRKRFISEDKKGIDYTTNELTIINDTSELVYEVTNTSRNYDASVSIVCEPKTEEDKVMNDYVTFDYSPKKLTVKAGEKETGSITATLTTASTEQKEFKITCTLTATPADRTELGEEYVEPFSNAGTMIAKYYSSFQKYKSKITNIVFENEAKVHETTEELTYDITAEGSTSPVTAYLVPNVDDTTKYTLYINSDGGVKANPNASWYFASFYSLKEISGLKYFDTSLVTNMQGMFSSGSLTELDLSYFNTSNVTNMEEMFWGSRVINLDLRSFDTKNVTNMKHMFYSMPNLISLNVEGFNTNQVTTMYEMFYGCRNLQSLNLSSFYTSKVIDMYQMFRDCVNLIELDVSNFDASQVTDMSYMFYDCRNLTKLDLSSFKAGKVTQMNNMFHNCMKMTSINFGNFDTSQVTNMSDLFSYCYELTELNLSSFNTSNVTNMICMFEHCDKLVSLDISSFDFSNVTDSSNAFMYVPGDVVIKVKDEAAQNWILTANNRRPDVWSTKNIIIA